MSARHPDRRRLQRWLDTGETRRVARHVERCDRCQAELESLSALDEAVVADLQAATTPPEDLRERTREGVDDRLRDEAALGAFLDLFAIGWNVTRAVIDPGRAGTLTDGDGAHDAADAADVERGGTR